MVWLMAGNHGISACVWDWYQTTENMIGGQIIHLIELTSRGEYLFFSLMFHHI